MASRGENCSFCGTQITGYGETAAEAEKDLQVNMSYHKMGCHKNPANQ